MTYKSEVSKKQYFVLYTSTILKRSRPPKDISQAGVEGLNKIIFRVTNKKMKLF